MNSARNNEDGLVSPSPVVPASSVPADSSSTGSVIYMDSHEAAHYLRTKYRTLMDWARNGVIPGIPLGRGTQRKTWLFLKSALDEHLRRMMEANRTHTTQEKQYVN